MTDSVETDQFDVVVYGASGFTGRLVAEYLLEAYGTAGELSWAMAGRNLAKLEGVRRELGADAADVPLLVADSNDRESLVTLAAQARVVATTVGPYALYGSRLVEACVETGTHYCDLTGEVHWMRKIIDAHHEAAARSGARIVHNCGFDSLPSDLEIVRAMPVSSAEVGASPTLIYPDHGSVRELFDYCGNALPVDDEACFSQGSVLACVYCWFFSLFDALIQANASDDLPHPINPRLVMGMARGAAQLALERIETPPRDIATAIATEGTYSKLGLDLLQQENAFLAWQQACDLLQQQLSSED